MDVKILVVYILATAELLLLEIVFWKWLIDHEIWGDMMSQLFLPFPVENIIIIV